MSLIWDLANTKTHIRDARECINSIEYVLFAVVKAIFSNRYDLDLIMNYIQTIVTINKQIKIYFFKNRKKNKVR